MSDTGGGHRSAAEAIFAALDRTSATSTVELLDFFATCAPFPLNKAGEIYGPFVNYAAPLWGAGFHLTNGRRRAAFIGSMISRLTHQCVIAKLRAFQPDVLACVHPLATRLASDVRRHTGSDFPLVTIVTDLVTTHASWLTRDVDLVLAPSSAVQAQAIDAGIPAQTICVTGQPVHPRFAEIDAARDVTREELALATDRFTVLLIGGGEGMGRVAEMATAIDEAGLPLQQIVVCGRNAVLRRYLEGRAWQTPTRVLGFTQNMPALMHAADVVVTKAGPSTICEALIVGRPILITGHVPGQERGNVDFVVEGGAGRLTETPAALIAVLQDLISPGSETRQCMTSNAAKLARPSAAMEIVQHLLDLAGG